MSHTVAVAELGHWLAERATCPGGGVAIMAGHFAIFSAGSHAVDLLGQSDGPPTGAAGMIDFTGTTWRIACELARHRPDRPFMLVPLVDDIQFVRPLMDDRRTAERLASALAADYLRRNPRLPPFHTAALAAHGLSSDLVLRCCSAHWLFSERQLRIAAVRRMRHHLGSGGATRAGVAASDDGATMTVTLPDHGEYCVVQAGHTSCAGGYVELITTLYDRGIRRLIALVPTRCLGQIVLGTELARCLFPLQRLSVLNVGMPVAGTGDTASVAESWD